MDPILENIDLSSSKDSISLNSGSKGSKEPSNENDDSCRVPEKKKTSDESVIASVVSPVVDS